MNLADRLNLCDDDGNAIDLLAVEEMKSLLQNYDVPFKSIGWDDYDGSLEIYIVPSEWRMKPELQKILYEAGFIKAYVNHIDHWETHYSFGSINGFKSQPGWRVSYPHKRPEQSGSIWVEKTIPSWPKDWFETGYVLIKKLLGNKET